VRVLYAHTLVLDGGLALGRLSFLARMIGHPRARGPQALLSLKDVLPDRYPIVGLSVADVIDLESKIGRLIDYGVIRARIDDLYASSARALSEPLLADLIRDGEPAYAWFADQRTVWTPRRRGWLTSMVELATRPSPAVA
jgi:hypothetical protein